MTTSTATEVGAGHGHHLHFHGHSLVHHLPAHVKLVTLLTYVVAVVLTPRTAYWAYGVYLLLVLALLIGAIHHVLVHDLSSGAIDLTIAISSGAMNVNASPVDAARPVRPIRCT